jgi:hypothetical protein
MQLYIGTEHRACNNNHSGYLPGDIPIIEGGNPMNRCFKCGICLDEYCGNCAAEKSKAETCGSHRGASVRMGETPAQAADNKGGNQNGKK